MLRHTFPVILIISSFGQISMAQDKERPVPLTIPTTISKEAQEFLRNAPPIPSTPNTPAEWKGARLYLELDSFERYGELLDTFRANIRKVAGDKSADAITAAIRFKIIDVRPLIAPSA